MSRAHSNNSVGISPLIEKTSPLRLKNAFGQESAAPPSNFMTQPSVPNNFNSSSTIGDGLRASQTNIRMQNQARPLKKAKSAKARKQPPFRTGVALPTRLFNV